MASTFFFKPFVTIPVTPIITSIIKHLMFHIRRISPYIYIIYSTIIIIIVSITLPSIYLLGNLHLSPTVLEICVLCDTLATVLLFAPILTTF